MYCEPSTLKAQHRFWAVARGWAPADVADLLELARLDRQLSFANTLRDYLVPFPKETADARRILGYVTLRSLCEGAIQLIITVYFEDYRSDIDAITSKGNNVRSRRRLFDQFNHFLPKERGWHI